MKELRIDVDVRASPARVWEVLTDLKRYPAWNPFTISAHGELKRGERLDLDFNGSALRPKQVIVTDVNPERMLSWRLVPTMLGLLDTEHVFQISPGMNAGCKVSFRAQFRGPLGPLVAPHLDPDLREGVAHMLRALRHEAELSQPVSHEIAAHAPMPAGRGGYLRAHGGGIR